MRDKSKTIKYAELTGYLCAYPDCESGTSIEVHHIIPLSRGGKDQYWNFIVLCRTCHKGNNLHTLWEDKIVALNNYKTYFELERFGFVLDDYNMTPAQIKNMLYDCRTHSKSESSLISRVRRLTKPQRAIAKEFGGKITCADISRIKKGVVPASLDKREALGVISKKRVPFCHHCDRYHDGSDCRPKKKPKIKQFDAKKFIFDNVFDVKYDADKFKEAALKLSPFQRKTVKDLWINSYTGITQERINIMEQRDILQNARKLK